MKLGHSLPEIKDYFKQLREPGAKAEISKYDVPLGGSNRLIEVYEVPISLPRYRLENTRTISMQEKYVADHDLPIDYFYSDPLSDELQEIQHSFLVSLIDRKGLREYFEHNEQTDPLILTNDGFVISGNRRLCAFRELLFNSEEGEKKFKHFERVRVVILPKVEEEEIEYIEDHYEQQEDIKEDFAWYDRAIGFRRRMQRHSYDTKKLAEKTSVKEGKIKELLETLSIAEQYLEYVGRPKDFASVQKDEFAFQQIIKARKKIVNDPLRKDLFEQLSFLAVQKQDEISGRMYDNIPYIQNSIDSFIEEAQSEFENELNLLEENKSSGNVFGSTTLFSDPKATILRFIESKSNEDGVWEILMDKIGEAKAEKQDRRKREAVLKKVKAAHKALVDANHIRDRESDKSGVLAQIASIEKVVAKLKAWASE